MRPHSDFLLVRERVRARSNLGSTYKIKRLREGSLGLRWIKAASQLRCDGAYTGDEQDGTTVVEELRRATEELLRGMGIPFRAHVGAEAACRGVVMAADGGDS